jgi:Tol biopolymer transport system component
MIDREQLERSAASFAPPSDAYERLIRRKARKDRRDRAAAAAVGLAIVVAGALVGAGILRSAEPDVVPIEPPQPVTPSPITGATQVQPPPLQAGDTVHFVDIETGSRTPLPRSIVDLNVARVVASPDRSQLAFEARGDGGFFQIFVASVDGGSVRRLTDEPGGTRLGGWSPDGSRIVYSMDGSSFGYDRFEGTSIGMVDVGSGQVTELFRDPGYLAYPTFAPDGGAILFTWARALSPSDAWRTDLWTIPPSGGEPTLLIEFGAYASYSPDGGRIAYRRTDVQRRAGCAPCWWVGSGNSVAAADGSEQPGPSEGGMVSLPSVFDDVQPQWSPDGTKMLWGQASNGVGEFFVRDLTTGERVSLGDASAASWFDDDTVILTDHSRRSE